MRIDESFYLFAGKYNRVILMSTFFTPVKKLLDSQRERLKCELEKIFQRVTVGELYPN
jgi:hypothetical protein